MDVNTLILKLGVRVLSQYTEKCVSGLLLHDCAVYNWNNESVVQKKYAGPLCTGAFPKKEEVPVLLL